MYFQCISLRIIEWLACWFSMGLPAVHTERNPDQRTAVLWSSSDLHIVQLSMTSIVALVQWQKIQEFNEVVSDHWSIASVYKSNGHSVWLHTVEVVPLLPENSFKEKRKKNTRSTWTVLTALVGGAYLNRLSAMGMVISALISCHSRFSDGLWNVLGKRNAWNATLPLVKYIIAKRLNNACKAFKQRCKRNQYSILE